jgi:hypothetical protein
VRTGPVYVRGDAAAGSSVMIWTNWAGQLTDPPLLTSQVATRADLGEELTVAALAIMLMVIGGLVRWVLTRRRVAAWHTDWLATGPRWIPRR